MFNLSGSELVFILLLALVVLGPEKLPDAARRFGKTFGELRRMGSGFQEEFRAGVDGPMKEMRETADLIRKNVNIGAGRDKPKSPSLMSVDIEPVRHDDASDGAASDEDASGDIDDDPTEAVAPAATDGFGVVPTFHAETDATAETTPEPTPDTTPDTTSDTKTGAEATRGDDGGPRE